MPGVGMRPPRRNTPSMPSVNSTRFRRSETVKMFFRLSITSPDSQYLCRSTRGGNFLGRLPAEFVRADGQRLADLATREHFDEPLRARHEPSLEQKLRR